MKRDPQTGKSKGFGFIRYKEYDAQEQVVEKRHKVDHSSRWCEVKYPDTGGRAVSIHLAYPEEGETNWAPRKI